MRPPTPRRERILGFGGPGAGKTRAWLTIADLYVKTKTPGKFYLLDTDDTYWSSVEEFPAVAEAGIVEPHYVYDFPSYQETAKDFAGRSEPDDWIIGDLFDKGWEEVQNYYSEQVFGADKGDFFLSMRKEMQNSKKKNTNFQPFEGWIDWPTIKSLHASWANDMIFRNKAHVFLTAGSKAVARQTDNKDTVETFGHIGAKPAGEKGLAAHGVNTVLMFSQVKAGEWVLDTAKDRGGRQALMKSPAGNFAMSYLVKVGGWNLTK
jgi:hypothetical protein